MKDLTGWRVDALAKEDKDQHELAMRACENAVRAATIVAAGRGSPTVDIEDIRWAIELSRESFRGMVAGVDRYTQHYYKFAPFCEKVLEAIRKTRYGFMGDANLHKMFRKNEEWGGMLYRVKQQLVREKQIEWAQGREGERGHLMDGYRLIPEEKSEVRPKWRRI